MSKNPELAPGSPAAGLVLAGGQGSRVGNRDKGLLPYAGKSLAEHVIARLAPQVGALAISANRNLAAYAATGLPVLQDDRGRGFSPFQGPLFGVLAGLAWAPLPWLACVPCDMPQIPLHLVGRLLGQVGNAPAAYAADAQHEHYLCCVVRRDQQVTLADWLAGGGRAVYRFWQHIGAKKVIFDDDGASFANFNQPRDFVGGLPAERNG